MKQIRKAITWLLCMLLVMVGISLPTKTVSALTAADFDVNTAWELRDDITSEHTAKETIDGGYHAYKRRFLRLAI